MWRVRFTSIVFLPSVKNQKFIRGLIKNYGECCCLARSNGKTGIFNKGSGASNYSISACDKFHLVRCSQSVLSYG